MPVDSKPSDWLISRDAPDAAHSPGAQTLFSIANGLIGIRASLEELPSPTDGVFITGVYETSPVSYHERLAGFSDSADARVPVVDGSRMLMTLAGRPLEGARLVGLTRSIDLRCGVLRRVARWMTGDGAEIEIIAERVTSSAPAAILAIRLQIRSISFTGSVEVRSGLDASQRSTPAGKDPRLGAPVADGGLKSERVDSIAGNLVLVQRARGSDIWVAATQAHACPNGLRRVHGGLADGEATETLQADLVPGDTVTVEKIIAYAWGRGSLANERLQGLATTASLAADAGFDALAAARRLELDHWWQMTDVCISGDARANLALRYNLFEVFQSTSRDPDFGTAAKGLTGEGYGGHVFWDSETYVLPLLAFTAPDLARLQLQSRWQQLPAARANARVLGHASGAAFPWRTIAGGESSTHYPTGAAQYHINAAIAQAVELYVAATADDEFLWDYGLDLVFETARIWVCVGHYSPARRNQFCLFGMTGPDEYTALVDNNYYTNRMASLHLRYAARTAKRLAAEAPGRFAASAGRLGLTSAEVDAWARASDAMYLPEDTVRGIDAQDDSFLAKPEWPGMAGRSRSRPLLLDVHPIVLYRHQVSKQADLILAMALAGDDVEPGRMRRNFDYYERVTTHDSTLSACAFAIVAARVGELDKAYDYFMQTALIDVEDLHGNLGHGSHIAALAGSWMAIVYGFAGLQWRDGTLRFQPVLPPQWDGLRFRLRWRGQRLEIDIGKDVTTYRLMSGETLTVQHDGDPVRLEAGIDAVRRNRRRSRTAA